MRRRRLDRELIVRGLAPDVEVAAQLIEDHRVLVNGAPAAKSSTLVLPENAVAITAEPRFASRGGEKLAGALQDLSVDPSGLRCLDAGAGSGGFTDCLLQAGASLVVAVDVGYGIIDWSLRNDPRVEVHERTNVKTIDAVSLGGSFDLVVADLSFISLRGVIDGLIACAKPEGDLLLLIKPQFEAPPKDVPPGGVIADASVWAASISKIARALWERGWGVVGVAPSRVRGAKGNREFFVHSRRKAPELNGERLQSAISSAEIGVVALPTDTPGDRS